MGTRLNGGPIIIHVDNLSVFSQEETQCNGRGKMLNIGGSLVEVRFIARDEGVVKK